MKSVLVSEKPIMCDKIANGKKTIIVKKKAPQEVPFKAYIYCCKGNNGYEWLYRVDDNGHGKAQSLHGKVIGEFICDKVDGHLSGWDTAFGDIVDTTPMCLTVEELLHYSARKPLYFWHISDLKIYDRPRALSEFGKVGFGHEVPLERPCAPWCYVEDLKEKKWL